MEWARMSDSTTTGSAPRTLLGRVWAAVRARHYSQRTEDAYVGWVKRFVVFHGRRHGGPRLRLRAVLGCGFRGACWRPAASLRPGIAAPVFTFGGRWLGALARLRFSEEQASGPRTSRIIMS